MRLAGENSNVRPGRQPERRHCRGGHGLSCASKLESGRTVIMKRFLPLMAVAALAACGEPSDKLSDEEASVQQGPASLDNDNGNDESETITAPSDLPEPDDAGPVLYKAVGTEPGWSLTVRPARMDYAGDYGQVNIAEPTPPDFKATHGTFRSGKLQVT